MRALVGRFAAMGIELTGGGLGGAVVGKPPHAAATFDAQDGRAGWVASLSPLCAASSTPMTTPIAKRRRRRRRWPPAGRRCGVVRPARLDVFDVAEARVGGAARRTTA